MALFRLSMPDACCLLPFICCTAQKAMIHHDHLDKIKLISPFSPLFVIIEV